MLTQKRKEAKKIHSIHVLPNGVGFAGKIKAGVAGKRHRLISHNAKYIRQNRGTKVMSASDAKIIKIFLPYGLS